MSILDDIIHSRRRRLDEVRARVPLAGLERAAEDRRDRRDFAAALDRRRPKRAVGKDHGVAELTIVAELKAASPSAGVLKRDYRPGEIARGYESAGAAALSVLTEEEFFRGSLDHLKQARAAAGVPVLRKDFILDAYQVYESVAAGADALLLIVAALADQELRRLLELADRLRIAALVEVHAEEELDRALAHGARIIGVNNRNLKTLEVSLDTSLRLRPRIPAGCLIVSESGIRTAADLDRLRDAGFDAALIGERFMLAEDPGRELAALLEAADRSQKSGVRMG
ncbi:MAG TPA: indole-3-glycerol phosphate synthase TrpC [Terriglobia bacterium]|nr:indole-3-glycerol phosphate synthase TrpC [Terriglobia bacterium]